MHYDHLLLHRLFLAVDSPVRIRNVHNASAADKRNHVFVSTRLECFKGVALGDRRLRIDTVSAAVGRSALVAERESKGFFVRHILLKRDTICCSCRFPCERMLRLEHLGLPALR